MIAAMKRREFITLLGGAAAAWPVTARGQQVPVIGLLSSVTARQWAPFVSAFLQGLNELGFVEGQNVATEQRWAGGQYDRLPAMATDLIQRKVAVIAALTTCVCRKLRVGRIGDADRRPGHATRCVRSAELSA
jgi:putative ABC transport system substrate-binding protein